MTRRLRFNGTDSKNGACPAVHEDLDSGEIIVQGTPLTDPEDVAQLQHFGPGDAAVVVPRELLVNRGPKEVTRVPKLIDLEEFGRLFETFEHSAWHLETRRGYASDRDDPGYAEFLATGTAPSDLDSEWCANIRRQTADGRRQVRGTGARSRQPADRGTVVPTRLCEVQRGHGRGRAKPVARGR